MRKIYMLTMSLFVCMGALAGNNGTIGDNLRWSFADGTLTISGNGEMEHAEGNSGYAWGTDNQSLDRNSIKKIVVEEGVTTLGEYIFWDCESLTEVKLPKTLTTLRKQCFKSCTSLKSITLPNNISLIEESAFENCSALETVTFPKSLKEVHEHAFYSCNLKKVDLSQTQVETIGSAAFAQNAHCEEVYLPKTLKTLEGDDEGTFSSCGVKKAVCSAVEPPKTIIGGYDFVSGQKNTNPAEYVDILEGSDEDFVLEVPAGSVERYKKADG